MAETTAERFAEPTEVSDAQVAFPATLDGLLPPWDEVPEEFRRGYYGGHEWCDAAAHWFYKGLEKAPTFKAGIDPSTALRHLKCCLGSFEPKHEHKIAGVGYLLSLWCKKPPA